MAIRKRGSTFMADFMSSGIRYRETFDTYEQAEQWELQARLAIKYGRELPPTKNQRASTGARLDTLGKLREHVLKTHWERLQGSKAAVIYSREVVKMLGPNKPVKELTKLDLQEVCSKLIDKGNSQATVNRKMATISKMLTEAIEHGVISKKPGIPKGKELSQQIRFLTLDEERKLIERFEHTGLLDWRDFVALSVDTGMRLGEIMRVRWDHLSHDWGIVHVWRTKSNKPRSIPLTTRAKAALQELYNRHPDSQGPFYHFRADGVLKRHLRDQWDDTCRDVGISKRIHDLRHTCASRLVQRGVDLLRVKDWLGHADIATTLRYAHLAPNDLEQCRKALEHHGTLP